MGDFWDEKDVEKETEEIIAREQRELHELLGTKIGRKAIYSILEDGYIFTTTFTKSSQGYVNEGKREMALKWFNRILDLDPFIFAKMCIEFRNKK